ncbi:MAG: hypothetical protein DCF22_12535 [Leptolyngbya sp.]|nr:MAG: hypothetical protein DCF22_12535 [Leptolyngbya sp.]
MLHHSSSNRNDAISHLRAIGFLPKEPIWIRLWLPKHTPIELAKRLGLAYEDKKGNWQLSVVNGFLTLGEDEKATFTQFFGKKKKISPEAWQLLEVLNRKGYNIGFVPNRGGKKDSEITDCWCLFYEADDKSLQEQTDYLRSFESELGHQATFALRTRKSLHCWFRLSERVDPGVWRIYQQRLAQRQQSDNSLHDPSQVMRLAGFFHQSVNSDSLRLWELLQAGELPESHQGLTEEKILQEIWESVPVAIVQDTGEVFNLEELDRVLPELQTRKKTKHHQSSNRSVTFPPPEPVPLQICLSHAHRNALEQGETEGYRNQVGFSLACDLLGVATYLTQQGQQFEKEPHLLFLEYCDRCNPPIAEGERQSIWKSAEEKSRDPALLPEQVKKCVVAFCLKQAKIQRENFGNTVQRTSQKQEAGKAEQTTIAQQLLEVGEEASYFHTPDDVAYADVWTDGIRKTHPVRHKTFKNWLRHAFYRTYQKVPGTETLNQVLGYLEAKACLDGDQRQVHLRLAKFGEAIYFDLGTSDWRVIEVDSQGWRLIKSAECPTRFRRPDHLLALPLPEPDGNLEDLKALVNLNQDSWALVGPWLLFCFYPDHPHPILILCGEAGTGKSFTASVFKSLNDPGKAPLLPNISDLRNLAIQANNRWVLIYDNLSYLGVEQSDALCRISTGGGFSTRTLHENDQETVFEYLRPQIITGIESLAERGDLLERALLVKLQRIPDDQRLTEDELNFKLNQLKPQLLGAFLTALSQTLKILPTVRPGKLPRLADFARFAIASEPALGLSPGSFLKAFQDTRNEAHEIVIEASPVAIAIQRLMESRTHWQGTATELLRELEALTDEQTKKLRGWAKDARSIGKILQRIAPDMQGIGLETKFYRKNSSRYLEIERTPIQTSLSSLSSHTLEEEVSTCGTANPSDVTTKSFDVTGNVISETPSNSYLVLPNDIGDVGDNKNRFSTSDPRHDQEFPAQPQVGDYVGKRFKQGWRGRVIDIQGDIAMVCWSHDSSSKPVSISELEVVKA